MKPLSSDVSKIKWVEELGSAKPAELWEGSLEHIQLHTKFDTVSFSSKIIHRIHYCHEKLDSIYPHISLMCDTCHNSVAGLPHLYFVLRFSVPGVMRIRIQPEPLLIILGKSDLFGKLNKAQQRFIINVL